MTRSSKITLVMAAAAVGLVAAGSTQGQTLELRQLTAPGIVMAVNIRNLPVPVAGYQAFLEFDPSRMTFVTGAYITTQFGLAIVNPIATNGNQITVASGINPAFGQTPSQLNQDVAILVFQSTGTGCNPRIRVRANTNPPTRMSDIQGLAVPFANIVDAWPTCPADYNNNGFVSVQDLFDFLMDWFERNCKADFNNVSGVSIQDLFDFLAAWFAGCP